MAAPNQLTKYFQSFKGLDLRSSDIDRSKDAATELKNMQFRQTGAMTKRKGYKFVTNADGGYGMATFNNVNTSTGAISEETITIDDDLHKIVNNTFTLTYTGSNSATYDCYYDSANSEFKFAVYEDSTLITNQSLGTGLEGSPTDISTLVTTLNGLTDFTCNTITAGGSGPAAFILAGVNKSVSASGTTVPFRTVTAISTPGTYTTPFSTFYGQRTDTNFENATFAQINDVLYISTGHDVLHKYDGTRVYKAGLPQATTPTAADVSEDTFVDGDVNTGTDKITLTSHGFSTGNKIQLFTSGTLPAGLTTSTDYYIIVDDANTVQLATSAANATAGTQIDITGAAGGGTHTVESLFDATKDVKYKIETQYTDAKGNIIYSEISDELAYDTTADKYIDVTYTELAASSGYDTDGTLVYNIFRTDLDVDASAGDTSLFYLVHTASHGDTIPFRDTGNDEGAQYVEPIKQRGLPPQGRYIDVWRDQLIISGIDTEVTKVAYSDIDSPEYFPTTDNAFNVSQKVTGLRSMNNVLYVFQERTIDGVTGDFGTDQFQVDNLSREGIGCAAHHTIAEVQGQLFFLSNRGVRSITPKGIEDVGFPIYPKFDVGNPFTFKQAVAYHWERQEKYLLFMPELPVDPSYSDDNDNEIYAFDTARKAWLEWDNFNFHGGITETDGDLYMTRRVLNNINISRIHDENDKYDYADHNSGISFTYKSHWETLGQPSVYKKYLRIKVHSYDTSVNDFEVDSFTLTVKTENDYNIKTLTNISLDFSGGALGWGEGPWGNFPWGESRLVQLRNKLASKKAKSMRTILENSIIHENVLISGYEIDVTTPYKVRLKA